MRRAQAIVFLSRTLSTFVIALRPDVDQPPAVEMREVAASLGPGEWIVSLWEHESTINSTCHEGVACKVIDSVRRNVDEGFLIRHEDYIRIPQWLNRVGNNLLQLVHAVLFAESEGIRMVKTPADVRAPVRMLFEGLPANIPIQPRKMVSAHCKWSMDYLHQSCSIGFGKEHYRHALKKYVKHHMLHAASMRCKQKQANDDLVIHLRGGDLSDSGSHHPQSRMPPCSFYRHLITANGFQGVTLVVEDGKKDHYCRDNILQAFSGSSVVVRETDHSFVDDACTIMTSRYVAFGLTTFADTLSMMSDNLKKVYVPSLRYNGHAIDTRYGNNRDICGSLNCSGNYVETCPDHFIEYKLYDVPGLEKYRTGSSKKKYIFQDGIEYPDPKVCGHCDD